MRRYGFAQRQRLMRADAGGMDAFNGVRFHSIDVDNEIGDPS
jgi:hypothetical protein